ncbi:MAG TPA: NAD(P)H-dependent glycerol-3-phosphate dehydrogenase [Dehalococcoidia bacterium]|nr:NAD(P)H-dependent glycerol-3-phosphate dehydrogenase [Dehalococcoidia bacterium]
MTSIAVLGAGSMGTAMAQVAAGNGHSVRLWSIELDVLAEVRDRRANSKYLPDVALEVRIEPCWGLAEALRGVEIALFSVPSQVTRAVARDAAPHLPEAAVVLNVAKGLEEGTDLRMSQVLAQELSRQGEGIVSMGGPAIAAELARHSTTAVVVAGEGPGPGTVQAAFQNEYFKVETSADVLGVELGATLKNVYAIALGMCDGLGLATNTKAFLATLAMREMASMIEALGGKGETVFGLAGLGDLLTTGYSPHSRNRTLGEKLCTDPAWPEFLHRATVEGVAACRSARDLAWRHGLATPLLDTVHEALFEAQSPAEAMQGFLRGFAYG